MSSLKRVVIVGGGASGALVCAHLLRNQSSSGFQVEWVGEKGPFGLGAAYSTLDPFHLLNVSADKMSAFEDDPEHLVRWLKKEHPEVTGRSDGYIRRSLFGEYMQSLIADRPPTWRLHQDEAINLRQKDEGFQVDLRGGNGIAADRVIIAVGNLSNRDSRGDFSSTDDEVRNEDAVLIVGTGLTAVDQILTLHRRGHTGPLYAVSKRGRLPAIHRDYRPHQPSELFFENLTSPVRGSPRYLLRSIRQECERAQNRGSDWRSVFDLVRAKSQGIWGNWTGAQRRSFLTHAASLWDMHRHRMAPEIGQVLESHIKEGALKIFKARIRRVKKEEQKFRVEWDGDNTPPALSQYFDHVFDCSGLIRDISKSQSEFIHNLLRQKILIKDEPPIGAHVNLDCKGLEIVGPLLRGSQWESIAIPELRIQAQKAVARLL